MHAETDASGQQKLQVQVNGAMQQLSRDQVCLPVAAPPQGGTSAAEAAPLPMRSAPQAWAVEELVASLKADTKSEPLLDEQAVFARVDGQWKAGHVVMRHPGCTRYSVLVSSSVYDLDRDALCARVSLPDKVEEGGDRLCKQHLLPIH